jgi:transposase
MKLFLGVDYAKKFSVATLINESGEIVKRSKLTNQRVSFESFLRGFSGIEAVTEAGRHWRVVVELVEGLVDGIKLAHPLKVKAIAEAKVKTDSIDSETLAQLLRANLIPEAHLRSKESSNRQKILRTRSFYVRIRTKVRNRIHHLIDGQAEEIRVEATRFSDLFGGKGKQWLRRLQLEQPDEKMLNDLLESEEFLCKRIQDSDAAVKDLFEADSDFKRVASIPGFGPFLSVLVVVEIDQIDRFPSASKLASYAGLVPSTYSSGGHTWHGKIHKQGNKWLRWAFVEAAIHVSAVRGDIRNFYFRIKRRKGTKIARVATARKLCGIVFRILKGKSEYQAVMKRRSRLQFAFSAS